MWDGFFLLLLLCLFMAGISFFVGSLPLSLTLSARQLRLVTALGTGVLVGTSLIVIIPEGIETLYSKSGNDGAVHGKRAAGLLAPRDGNVDLYSLGGNRGYNLEERDAVAVSSDVVPAAEAVLESPSYVLARDEQDSGGSQTDPTEGDSKGNEDVEQDDDPEDNTGEHDDSHDPHAWIGLSLISGFILMYLIDTLPKQAASSSRPQRFSVSLGQFSLHRNSVSAPSESETASMNGDYRSAAEAKPASTSRPSSTTTGLVIHAIADGIALGASSTTTSRLSFIIFLALIIHKAPAAFGLTSVLLKQGLSKRQARAHLIVFAIAAPIGALLTFALAHLLGVAAALEESGSTEFATGVLLLFSAGTFLYVAMHTMQEQGDEAGHAHGGSGNGYVSVPMSIYGEQSSQAPREKEASSTLVTFVTVAGMLVPLITQLGHAH